MGVSLSTIGKWKSDVAARLIDTVATGIDKRQARPIALPIVMISLGNRVAACQLGGDLDVMQGFYATDAFCRSAPAL